MEFLLPTWFFAQGEKEKVLKSHHRTIKQACVYCFVFSVSFALSRQAVLRGNERSNVFSNNPDLIMTRKPDYSDLMFGYTTDQAINEGLLFDPRIRFENKNVFVSSEFIYELNKEEIIIPNSELMKRIVKKRAV